MDEKITNHANTKINLKSKFQGFSNLIKFLMTNIQKRCPTKIGFGSTLNLKLFHEQVLQIVNDIYANLAILATR